jgi:hypothetical protein
MERIRFLRFSIPHFGPFRPVHGDNYSCEYNCRILHVYISPTADMSRIQFTWGPMCFIIAAFIATSHPLRHPLQIIVCVGQIYGLILYYATSMFDHYYNQIAYSRPEAWYFWGYYFFMNFIWMVLPGSMLPYRN